jgi:hypothetical protein
MDGMTSSSTLSGITTPTAGEVVKAALSARTYDDAAAVNDLIALRIGERHTRFVADRVSTHGLLTTSGKRDNLLVEIATNLQDPVLELEAMRRFGDLDKVPYASPHEAASALLGHLTREQQAELCKIDVYEAEPPAREKRRVTVAARDHGCGIRADYVPTSIFYGGSIHKDAYPWMQGAFGIGGTTTYPHARAVVLVSRRHPDLLEPGQEDEIVVAVCEWSRNVKGRGLWYLTDKPWPENADAKPHTVLASEVPEFAPGTYLALISYETEGLHSGRTDRNSLEFLLNTRLYEPVVPLRLHNQVASGDHPKTIEGLKRRFAANKRPDREELTRTMPFRIAGATYQLPVDIYYFKESPGSDKGAMRNFVAKDHTVCFTSNGQVHRNWTKHEFEGFVRPLPKLSDRLLVAVSLDPIPIDVRTAIFTPDRSGFVAKDDSQKLEDAVAAFLPKIDELVEANNDIIRQTIQKRHSDRPTIAVARKIARALRARGFSLGGTGAGTDDDVSHKKRKQWAKADLYCDPTALEGPDKITVVPGETRYLRYHVNAKPEFFASGRGKLEVISDCPSLGEDEIAPANESNKGIVTVALIVPETTPVGTYTLCAGLSGWLKSNGSIGPNLSWDTTLEVVAERKKPETSKSKSGDEKKGKRGKGKADEGTLVAVLWRDSEAVPGWHDGVPGHVEEAPAHVVAEDEGYKELAALGSQPVTAVFLNEKYTALENYEKARAKDSSERALLTARDRYAVGLGLGLILHEKEKERRRKAGETTTAEADLAERQFAARSVLAMLPDYDELAREAGVE